MSKKIAKTINLPPETITAVEQLLLNKKGKGSRVARTFSEATDQALRLFLNRSGTSVERLLKGVAQ